ncbi:MAG: hypothetical protein IPG77_15480 [Betaproteobacteria bacterium]|jgi:hypothetical protein|nr:hypothetical protein [Betaproteobacteria bacterium]
MKPTPCDDNTEPQPYLQAIPMPRLGDDAVIQIHDFIHHVLDLFEARYGDQIHRFYQDLCSDNLVDSNTHPDLDDPPF